MPRSVPFLVAISLFLGVLVVGCASAAQQAVQQAAGVEVKQGGNQVTVKGADGQSMTVDSSIPDELKDFAVPKGFTSQGGGTMSVGGDKMGAVSWKGTGDAQAVLDFFKSTLPGKGWKEDSAFVSGDGGMLNYSKPDGYGLTVTVSKESGDNITIAVLGGKSSKTPTPMAEATAAKQQAAAASKSEPTETPEPTAAPKAPTTGSVSALPAELRDQPIPSGFAPIKDKSVRLATGGQFQMAGAEFFGKASVQDASEYYRATLVTKGWNIDVDQTSDSEQVFVASSKTDSSLHLSINISEEDAGTRIYMQVSKT